MIKKNTKVVFEDGENSQISEMIGGMPLSKGEIVHLHPENSEEIIDYEVVDKITDCYLQGDDQVVNIEYVLRKK